MRCRELGLDVGTRNRRGGDTCEPIGSWMRLAHGSVTGGKTKEF
jgi:hypothetical protein